MNYEIARLVTGMPFLSLCWPNPSVDVLSFSFPRATQAEVNSLSKAYY